jgi:hypothetical protein
VLLLGAAGLMLPACLGFGGGSGKGCGADGLAIGGCPEPQSTGEHFRTGEDGRLRATTAQVWPDRAPEPPRLTAQEVASGCAAYAACAADEWAPRSPGKAIPETFLASACLGGTLEWPDTNREERAIPLSSKNERWDFVIREVLATKGDCRRIRSVLTPAPEWLYCEEDGCISRSSHTVTCNGDVAVFDDGTERDCSRAHARCSETSETGCTDRRFSSCEEGALSRCDGDVKLGCDGCGFVSFRNCAWNGGHCEESADGATCVASAENSCSGLDRSCGQGGFDTCVFGSVVRVDCAGLGMACANDFARGWDTPPSGFCRELAPNERAFGDGGSALPDSGADAAAP